MESTGSYKSEDLGTLEATELRLGLPGTDTKQKTAAPIPRAGSKRSLVDMDHEECKSRWSCTEENNDCQENAPVAKAQVVGWPPVRSFRKNTFLQARNKAESAAEKTATATATATAAAAVAAPGLFVKVSMDGAPYLRKIDLNVYQGYKELRQALDTMFKCFSGKDSDQYAIAYEDKDGDWMLAGDVPWGMFTSSCKRLRIMKGSEAKGLGSSP